VLQESSAPRIILQRTPGGWNNPDSPDTKAEARFNGLTDHAFCPNTDQTDDADLSGDYYANTALHIAQIATLTGNTLFDRCSVSPDSEALPMPPPLLQQVQ
jgi:hypothetical protein